MDPLPQSPEATASTAASPPVPPPKPAKPAPSPVVKTGVADILAADAEDESLRKYKDSLLGAAAKGDLGNVSDPRRVVITEFRVMFDPSENHPDMIFNTDSEAGLNSLKATGLTMKEGCKYKFRISFRVQHEIVAGLKFENRVKRMMIADTDEFVLGSYPPSSTPHVFEFPKWDYIEAPVGMMFRGSYNAKNTFVDADGATHLEYDYPLHIKKEW